MRPPDHVTVVGAGIAGLVAARTLSTHGVAVRLVERATRLGGKIDTGEVAGIPIDRGPDAFLARAAHVVDLCRELGLAGELVAPATGEALLWAGDRGLLPLPGGLVLGVPTDFRALARSGVLTHRGLARAALDAVLPARHPQPDVDVRTLVARRFGTEVADRLVDPLVGAINAASTRSLSASVATPQLLAAARTHRSLAAALRAQRRESPTAGPVFQSLRGGLGVLVDAIVADLQSRGVSIETGVTVDRLDGPAVLAVPASQAARLVAERSPAAARELAAIRYTSVALVTATVPAARFADRYRRFSGFLVPRSAGRLLTAVSFGTSKWPHWAPPGRVVLRLSAGWSGDQRALSMPNAELVRLLGDELGEASGLPADLGDVAVTRWSDAFPQYPPGHLERVTRIEAALASDLPGVVVAGASYRGVGIPTCVASGQSAAAALVGA